MDASSRRAVLNLSEPDYVLDPALRDVACASTLQFLIRDGRLHAVVNMRSNDAVWGLPYDIFLFSMLQELLASDLGLPLGSYFHFVGSLHLYERHFDLARRVLERSVAETPTMPTMRDAAQSTAFIASEQRIRTGQLAAVEELAHLDKYWRDLAHVLLEFNAVKSGSSNAKFTYINPEYTRLMAARFGSPEST
jgi:thymidylate synthase